MKIKIIYTLTMNLQDAYGYRDVCMRRREAFRRFSVSLLSPFFLFLEKKVEKKVLYLYINIKIFFDV